MIYALNVLCKGTKYVKNTIHHNCIILDEMQQMLMNLISWCISYLETLPYFSAAPLPKNTQGKPVLCVSIWRL